MENHSFTTPDVSAGAGLGVMFTNDCFANSQDRNLPARRVDHHQRRVTFDAGFGSAAFDGKDVQPGPHRAALERRLALRGGRGAVGRRG